jgi:hypothetical protein
MAAFRRSSDDANHRHGPHFIACGGREYVACSLREKQTLKKLDMRYRFVSLVAYDKANDETTGTRAANTNATTPSEEVLIR